MPAISTIRSALDRVGAALIRVRTCVTNPARPLPHRAALHSTRDPLNALESTLPQLHSPRPNPTVTAVAWLSAGAGAAHLIMQSSVDPPRQFALQHVHLSRSGHLQPAPLAPTCVLAPSVRPIKGPSRSILGAPTCLMLYS
jgi:hypothetical protein